jgi:hypothetical protein
MQRAERLLSFRAGDTVFYRDVPSSGYEWRDDLGASDLYSPRADGLTASDLTPPFLVARRPDSRQVRRIAPLRGRAARFLHRDFAAIAGANAPADAILRFANRHGHLLPRRPVLVPKRGGQAIAGESLATWCSESQKMATLLAWWDAARGDSDDEVAPFLTWNRREKLIQVYSTPRCGRMLDRRPETRFQAAVLTWKGPDPELLRAWQAGEGFAYAAALRYIVAREVNRKLTGHVSLQLAVLQRTYVTAPDSVLAALYLILGNEVLVRGWAEDRKLDCQQCGQPFARVHGRQRYCSEKCRKKYYDKSPQRRRTRATRRAGNGASHE